MKIFDADKGGLAAEVRARMEADLRARIRHGMKSAGEKLKDRAPVLTGEFRDSFKSYGPVVDDNWKPGADAEVGYHSGLPQSERLAKGWSRRAPRGWLDIILAETNREMEGVSRGDSAIVLLQEDDAS